MTRLLAVVAAALMWVVGARLILGAAVHRGRARSLAVREAGDRAVSAGRWLRWVFTPLWGFDVTEVEQAERQRLLDRPGEEEFLHWAYDGWRWRLHGHLAPPAEGRRLSTTATGWCRAGLRGAGSGTLPRRWRV